MSRKLGGDVFKQTLGTNFKGLGKFWRPGIEGCPPECHHPPFGITALLRVMSSQPSLSLKNPLRPDFLGGWIRFELNFHQLPQLLQLIQRRETHKFGTEQLGVIPISVSPPAKKTTKRTMLQQFVASFFTTSRNKGEKIYLNSRIYVTWRMVGFQDFCRTSHPSSKNSTAGANPKTSTNLSFTLDLPHPRAPGCNRLWHS